MNGTDDKVTAFPRFNVNNIPEALRKLANDIEATPDIATTLLVIGMRADRVAWSKLFGKDTKVWEASGLLDFARFQLWRDI